MGEWIELPYGAWRDTRDTLHMYLQIVGKIRHSLSPEEPDWGHAPLYVTARGVTTSPVPHPGGVFDIDVDFIEHVVSVRKTTGEVVRIRLESRSVADFYGEMMSALDRLGIPATIETKPSDIKDGTPFDKDVEHASYDSEWANRFWHVVVTIDSVLKEHRARFVGRVTPVELWWGSFDLAYARYSGRAGMTDEHVLMGFWPGDATTQQPAFYAFASPKPDGIESAALRPPGAEWSDALGEFFLPYDTVRTAADPRQALLDFLDSTHAAGAAGWTS